MRFAMSAVVARAARALVQRRTFVDYTMFKEACGERASSVDMLCWPFRPFSAWRVAAKLIVSLARCESKELRIERGAEGKPPM